MTIIQTMILIQSWPRWPLSVNYLTIISDLFAFVLKVLVLNSKIVTNINDKQTNKQNYINSSFINKTPEYKTKQKKKPQLTRLS